MARRRTRPAAAAVAVAEHAEAPHEHIHMPNPSYWPLVTAAGLFFLAAGSSSASG